MTETIYNELRDSIIALDGARAKAAAEKGLSEGLDPLEMINGGIRPALDVMGERFGNGDLFLPELVLAAKASDQAVAVLEPELLKSGDERETLGKFLIATVKGDIHDIGKNIVALLLKSNGFEVTDIGVNKSNEEILKAAKEIQADIIGLSALLTTTMPEMKAFFDVIQESGERDNFKVLVGGAPVTKSFADEIGADGYGADASRAVEIAKKMMA